MKKTLLVLCLLCALGASWYTSNRTRRDASDDTGLSVVSPDVLGIDKGDLDRGHNELARSSRPYSFLVLRDGRIAYERYYNNQDVLSSNNVHSASKSILCVLAETPCVLSRPVHFAA